MKVFRSTDEFDLCYTEEYEEELRARELRERERRERARQKDKRRQQYAREWDED